MPKIAFSPPNTLRILELIRTHKSISRLQVGEKTGFSPFLVSNICDKLLAADFITEAGQGDSTGGRRPTLLTLRPDFGRLIGIHLGTVNVRIALSDFSGNLLEYTKAMSYADRGPEVAMRHVMELIDKMLKRAGLKESDLNGIGLGVSGVVERGTGAILYWPKLPLWINVPAKNLLAERYKTLVKIDDTSRTKAYAEYRLGGAGSAHHFIYIAMGSGIGAAILINGSVYSGAGGFAGEFGHMTVSETGPLCSCGNRGCLETMVSAVVLIRKARQGLSSGLSNALMEMSKGDAKNISMEMVGQAARTGDRFAARLIADAGADLGRGVVGLVNLLNPELIVIGGGVASAIGDLLLPAVQRVVNDRAMIHAVKQVQVKISELDEKDWARGATFLVAESSLAECVQKKLRIIGRSSR